MEGDQFTPTPTFQERKEQYACGMQLHNTIHALTNNTYAGGHTPTSSDYQKAINAIEAWEEQTGQHGYLVEHPYAQYPMFQEAQSILRQCKQSLDAALVLPESEKREQQLRYIAGEFGVQKASLVTNREHAYITTTQEQEIHETTTDGYLVGTDDGFVFFAIDPTTIWPEALTKVCLEGYIEFPFVQKGSRAFGIPNVLVCSLGRNSEESMLYFANTTLLTNELKEQRDSAQVIERRHIIT